jgi:RNA polymerase sigma-70 factor (ECF subfamily)
MRTGESDQPDEILSQFEEAYAEYGGSLLRFATRLCGRREDAEDVVVEAFTHAYLNWNSFRGTGSRRSWLYGIALNRYRRWLRGRRADPNALHEYLIEPMPSMLDRVVLNQGIAQLSERRREAFLLVKAEGLTCREAAEVLGRPLGTVLSDVHKAILTLRNELRGGGETCDVDQRLCEVEP